MLIGLTGPAQAGKDTTAAYLVENYGFIRVSFTALLYESIATLLGVSVEQLERWKLEDDVTLRIARRSEWTLVTLTDDITIRTLLQRMGTEVGRNMYGYDFWVRKLFNTLPKETIPTSEYGSFTTIDGNYVISDCRFDNEAREVKRFGGVMWSISRKQAGLKTQHASEAGINVALIDAVIENNKKLADLHKAIDLIMKDYGLERTNA